MRRAAAQRLFRGLVDGLDDGRIGRHFEWVANEKCSDSRMKIGVRCRESIGDFLNLSHCLSFGFTRNGPPLDFHDRLRRVGAESGASGQYRRCSDGGPTRGCGGRARNSRSSSASSWRNAPIFIFASIPRLNLLPCAARPVISTSIHR